MSAVQSELSVGVGAQEPTIQVVSFRIGAEEFALDILLVQEINRVMKMAPVPGSPPFVEGVANLRGRVVPVMDLRKMLSAPAKEHDAQSRVIIIRAEDKIVGFIVDAVLEVVRIPKSAIDAAPSNSRTAHCLEGVGRIDDRLIALLNPQKLLVRYGLGVPEALAA